MEPQLGSGQGELEQRRIIVIADKLIRQPRAPRIGRPTDRYAHLPPTRPASGGLHRGQRAGLDDLDHAGSKRTRSPASRRAGWSLEASNSVTPVRPMTR